MSLKELLGSVAIVLTFCAFYPYLKGVLKGSIQPHVLSWVIWAIATFVVFLAQLQSHGGAGSWPIGVSGSITFCIAVLAYFKRADISITKLDWTFLVLALLSLPLWFWTQDPVWSVLLLTIIDLFGFGPTLRKLYFFPRSESILFFALILVRNLLALAALESYSVTTWFFPAATAAACAVVLTVVFIRLKN